MLFDTNVYIEAIQSGPATDVYHLLLTTIPRTYVSAVVVQELYAGALDAVGERLVARFVRQTERTGRVVIPTYRDWSEAGHVLARINRQEPAQRTRLARLVNDVLLAMCANNGFVTTPGSPSISFPSLLPFCRLNLLQRTPRGT